MPRAAPNTAQQTAQNTQILLSSRPQGEVTLDNFKTVHNPVPDVRGGHIVVRNIWLSLDPYMRGRMNDVKSYTPPFQLGEVLQGQAVGEVVASKHDNFSEGDLVTGMFGWENYTLAEGEGVRKLTADGAPLPYYLSILGVTGLTAYVGLFDIGKLQTGDNVFVSAAAGAVGSAVGQIAKLKGCRVVGTAGSDEKIDYLKNDLGFDDAFNYKTAPLNQALAESCPDGIDLNFENVGGELLEAVLNHMNDFGRITICGMISHYNDKTPRPGPRNLPLITSKRLSLQGFIVSDHLARMPSFIEEMSGWLKEGKVKQRETVAKGIENAPEALIGMLGGDNLGKQLVKVGDEPSV